MGTELYINGYLVDLQEQPVFPLTFSVIELTDLSKRSGAKSKTITLPGTSRNCALLNSIYTLDSAQSISSNQSDYIDFDPTIKATAMVYQNSLLQFNGVAQLLSCKYVNNSWSFEISLISEMRDYIAEMAKVKINELDFSEFNHALTFDNVKQTWDGVNKINGIDSMIKGASWYGIGYYYGIVEYGYKRPNQNTWYLNQIPPSVFVYGILVKLFEKIGLTWSSEFLETDLFKRIAMPWFGGDFPNISSDQADNDSAYSKEIGNTGDIIMNGSCLGNAQVYDNGGTPEFTFSFGTRTFTDVIDSTAIQDNIGQLLSNLPLKFKCQSAGLFNVNYYGTHKMDLVFDLSGASFVGLGGQYTMIMNIYKNGAIYSQEEIYSGVINSTSLSQSFSNTFSYSRPINASVNDEFTTAIRLVIYLPNVDISGWTPNTNISYQVQVNTADVRIDYAKQVGELLAGNTITLKSFLPDMQGDVFFNGICKMFNLIVSPSKDDPKRLEIDSLVNYYQPTSDAVNWTAKVDESQEIEIIPSINFATKNYNFRFANSEDYYNQLYFNAFKEKYGDFSLHAQNEYGTDDTTYQLPFSQMVLANIPLTETTFTGLVTPQCWAIGSDSNIAPKQVPPFLVQVGLNTIEGEFNIIDESDALQTIPAYPYIGHFDDLASPTFDLNFGVPQLFYYEGAHWISNNLYDYHERFIKEIVSRYGKLLKCNIHLTSTDIFTMDFQKLINLGGVIYRVQKIIDYNSSNDNSTKVELLKYIS